MTALPIGQTRPRQLRVLALCAALVMALGTLACDRGIRPEDVDAFATAATARLLSHLADQDSQAMLPPEGHVRAFFRRVAIADAAVVAEATAVGSSIIGPGGEDLGMHPVHFTTRKVLLGVARKGWTSKLSAGERCAVEAPALGTRAFTLIVYDGEDTDLMLGLPPPFFVVTNQHIKLWGHEVSLRALRRIIAASRDEVSP